MTIRTVSAADFYSDLGPGPCVYTSEAFTRLNASRAEIVRYFAGYDDRMRPVIGLAAGLRDNTWLAPFSAPYSMLVWHHAPSTETIYDFLTELTDMLDNTPGSPSLRITLPPQMLIPDDWTRVTIVAANMAKSTYYDYNYHYPLSQYPRYTETLTSEAKRHLKRAECQGFDFGITDDIERVYRLIEMHHRDKGYPMAMSIDDVVKTGDVIESDYFVLTLKGQDIAACYSQRVADGVSQLINWGDIRQYSSLRPMNMMARCVCRYYAELGFRAYDFGPASTAGIPNIGLCRFKKSLGGVLSLKPTFCF